jgi:hypothetical protein
MLATNKQTAERPAMALTEWFEPDVQADFPDNESFPFQMPLRVFNSKWSDADECDVPDEPCQYYPNGPDYDDWGLNVVEYTPIQWDNNTVLRGFDDLIEVDDQPDTWQMVQFTMIEWLNDKATKLYEDWINLDFNFDLPINQDWADLPF